MPSTRLYFLDWLRIAAFGLLVPFHVGMLYVLWPFHVKSPYVSKALNPWMMLTSPWRMSLIFLIAGAASAVMLKGRADLPLFRERARRLLLPLLCGMLLVIPPQTYFEVVEKHGYTGSFFEFLGLYYSHFRGFCQAGRCLDMPTWNHLWFLPYLWIYTCLLWLWLRLSPQGLHRLAQRLNPVAWVLLPWLVLFTLRLLLHHRFPQSYDVIHDGYMHAQFLFVFLLGGIYVNRPEVWTCMAGLRWLSLALALLSWWSFVLSWGQAPKWVEHVLLVSEQWFAILALTGFAVQHLNRDHRWRATLTEAVFPVYIFHQTWLIVLSRALRPLDWMPRVEGPVIIVATFCLSWASYLLVRRLSRLRPWFGMKKTSGVAPTA